MTRQPTIEDVARTAGVSKGLVSLALNGRPGVAQETRKRIDAAVAELGWRPSANARGLATKRAYSLGFIVRRDPITFQADPFFASFLAGVESVLAERDQVLVLSVVPDVEREFEAYRRLTSDRRVDGFLITDLLQDDPRVRLVADLGQRAVTLGRPDSESPFPAIVRDYDAGIDELLTHLAELGHRRVAHVAGDERMQHATTRLTRHLEVAARLGLQTIVEHTDFSPESGAAATHRLLDRSERPTAIVYANDPMAIAGIAVAHERGLTLPRDLSITGMDGSDTGRFVYPALTTLDNDPVGWGRAAATALLSYIENGDGDDVTLPAAALILRSSTAPPGSPG
ncbi:LacI family DNA-binding transcriptional regulator [Gryllotalpicola ginsengisoli]|uniref:LacI family DNA-binding transcriptional regulator n=1 Tax=Gryllotalpicola ginsengisoli TaxID=444608 RepID=UPI0003B562DC|nr:LacI family DNA-binding transcriptional regulator [Gryllotalpicola ginsengisoli]